MGLLVAGVALLAIGVTNARADASVDSFQFTNILAPATVVSGAPTNVQSGTTNILTGRNIETRNYDKLGITVQATTTATNTGNLTFVIARANVNGTPIASDFETLPLLTVSAPVVVGTNVNLVWTTNLADVNWGNASTHVGISSGTNTCVAGALTTASNVVVKITRKRIAVTY